MKKTPFIIFIVSLILLFNSSAFGQTKELELYNEWFVEDSDFTYERPIYFIRDSGSFHSFWKQINYGDNPPYLDFDRFMIMVWAPGTTRRDYSKVVFERVLYKEDCLLVLMDFIDGYRRYGSNKKPLKFVILPIVKPCDVFIYKKIKKGWRKYDWKHLASIWDMSGERKRPFQIVQMDKIEEQQIVLATYTPELEKTELAKKPEEKSEETEVQKPTPKPVKVVKPVAVVTNAPIQQVAAQPVARPQQPAPQAASSQNQQNTRSQPAQTSQNNQPKTKPVVSDAPIDFGGGSKSSAEPEPKPAAAPGMAEDPLFGSEFDITF